MFFCWFIVFIFICFLSSTFISRSYLEEVVRYIDSIGCQKFTDSNRNSNTPDDAAAETDACTPPPVPLPGSGNLLPPESVAGGMDPSHPEYSNYLIKCTLHHLIATQQQQPENTAQGTSTGSVGNASSSLSGSVVSDCGAAASTSGENNLVTDTCVTSTDDTSGNFGSYGNVDENSIDIKATKQHKSNLPQSSSSKPISTTTTTTTTTTSRLLDTGREGASLLLQDISHESSFIFQDTSVKDSNEDLAEEELIPLHEAAIILMEKITALSCEYYDYF